VITYGSDVEAFVAAQLGFDRGFGECQAIGFVENGKLFAGFVYHNWSPETQVIEVSGASLGRKWATRTRLSAIFSYPFDLLKCRMVVARHSERNVTVRRIWRSLGADEYIIPELRGPSEAEVIATLTADRWYRGKFSRVSNGQAKGTSAS
jgi:hypothetical protein